MSSSRRWSATRRVRWAAALGSAVLLWVFGGCGAPPDTCCPTGPPYLPVCSEGYYYYHHGNQLQPSPSASQMLTQSPWRHMGRVLNNGGAATGVLIHPNYVLTAAHVVMSGFDEFPEYPPKFQLAQACLDCLPYGWETVNEIWVPQEWIDNIGGDYDSEETRAYDWALLEVDLPESHWSTGVPDPLPMPTSNETFPEFDHLVPRSAGYACGKQADGSARRKARPYTTAADGAFLNQVLFPPVGGAEGGSLIRTTLEGTAGMSGGPVWIERSGQNELVGILIGSPQEVCNGGVMWVAGLSPNTRQRINQVINTGSAPGMVGSGGWSSGSGGWSECGDTPCPVGFGVEDVECGNVE